MLLKLNGMSNVGHQTVVTHGHVNTPTATNPHLSSSLYTVQRNYRTFLLFIYTTSIYIMWTFGVSLGMLFVKHDELVAEQQQQGQQTDSAMWLTTLGGLDGGSGACHLHLSDASVKCGIADCHARFCLSKPMSVPAKT